MKEVLALLGRRIIQAIEVVRLYRNWWYAFLCYFRLLRHQEVTYVLRNGIKFKVKASDLQSVFEIDQVWLRQIYIPVRDEIQNGSAIVDIGAHIGSFSIFAATRADDVKVYSYEPSQENFHFLIDNIKLNRLKNIKAFPLAVSGRRGKARLYIGKHSAAGSIIIPRSKLYEEVNCVTLEDVLVNNEIETCDLLKMDCEGAEYEILFSAPESTLMRIRNISLEYHDVPAYHVEDLKRYLENMGFDVWLSGKTPILYASKRA